ncbi:hypothetical protein [Nocardiopsis sp. YSL2]|uniref:hypothetical protein n=1 Tax=Nocardiopsis sp. YSL2 TaxID=2939492 RepID=UPI0026F42EA8|nr:hypothetical protein [Nocardiopsis sp. YSL2]
MESAFYVLVTVVMVAFLLHVVAQRRGRAPRRAVTGALAVLLVGLLVVDFLMILGVFG